MSVWKPDNVVDIAESVGVGPLDPDVTSALTGDIEFRISQVLEEALRFMKHARRTTLTTQDISQALRILEVEPLYGYESTRPLRFGEASLGPGQPLFYVSDEEIDFEKLINAPLPKVPREITLTAHWLAIEGVQPSIPQNPTSVAEQGTTQKNGGGGGNAELLPRGPSANPYLPALAGMDNPTFKPLVKHVLSAELQLYFSKVSAAVLDPDNDEHRLAALASLRSDPGLHQLLPYFVNFVAEKVTHNLTDLFVLTSACHLTDALLDNPTLFIDPYVAALVPPVLTCLISPRLGPQHSAQSLDHYALRNLAASLLGKIASRFAKASTTLKPRLVRTCLKAFLDPKKPLPVHYGALRGITHAGGREAVAVLIVPNLKEYSSLLEDPAADRRDVEMVLGAVVEALENISPNEIMGVGGSMTNGTGQAMKGQLEEKLGGLIAGRYMAG